MRVEFTEDERRGRVVAGVDTHLDTHWLCVLDERGAVLASGEFPADAAGYDALADALGDPGSCLAVGVEGTKSYGAGLCARLAALGYRVYEVLRPKRPRRRPGECKSDPADAERAARDVLAGSGLSVPKDASGWVEEARWALAAHERCVAACVSAVNAARGLLATGPEGARAAAAGRGAAELLSSPGGYALPGAMGRALEALAATWRAARAEADALEGELERLLRANCPALLGVYCCGAVDAARLAVAAGGNPERVGGEAAFAALCGASPVRCSSGRSDRHRLNLGGNRRANSALHAIAVRRLAWDPETRAYAERRAAEGKNRKEIVRCLKRYIAREAYRAITRPFLVPTGRDREELAAARRAAGLTQAQAAAALRVSRSAVSGFETGRSGSARMLERYRRWVGDGLPVDVAGDEGQASLARRR